MAKNSRTFVNKSNDTILLICSCKEVQHGALTISIDKTSKYHYLTFATHPYPTKNFWERLKNAWYEITGQTQLINHCQDFIVDKEDFNEFCKAGQELLQEIVLIDDDSGTLSDR